MTKFTPDWMLARTGGAIALIAIVASTSACGSPALPSSSSTAVAGITTGTTETTDDGSTATPSPCEALLGPSDVATILGAPGTVMVGTADPLLALVGGFECEYSFDTVDPESDDEDDEDYTAFSGRDMVYVAVAPASVTSSTAIASSLIPENCATTIDQGVGCFATVSVGGWWYSLMVESSISPTVQRTSFEQITIQLEKSLSAMKAPAQVSGVQPFDCTSVNTGGLTVHSSRTLALSYIGSEQFAAAFLLAGPVMCEFTLANSETWDVTVYPGGAAAFDQCRFAATNYDPNSSPFEVDGVESVYELSNTGDQDRYCATDGTSLVSVFHESSDEDAEETDPADTLSTLLPPTFTAIEAAG
jgi:hypothetical protein